MWKFKLELVQLSVCKATEKHQSTQRTVFFFIWWEWGLKYCFFPYWALWHFKYDTFVNVFCFMCSQNMYWKSVYWCWWHIMSSTLFQFSDKWDSVQTWFRFDPNKWFEVEISEVCVVVCIWDYFNMHVMIWKTDTLWNLDFCPPF